MYIPKQFKVEDKELIYSFIRNNGFATLISSTADYPLVTHIPIELEERADGEKVLWGHVAKGNRHWRSFDHHPEVLAVFLSPIHHYISSSWYDHPNAPTYNYMSIQVKGRIRRMNTEEEWESVRRLVRKYEHISEYPVDLDKLPHTVQAEMKGLVGFEISIDHIDAAFKLSQNRDDNNYERILEALRKEGSTAALQMAEVMKQARPSK